MKVSCWGTTLSDAKSNMIFRIINRRKTFNVIRAEMKKRDDKREEIGLDGSKRIREERISIALRLAKEKRAQLDFLGQSSRQAICGIMRD